MITEDLTKPDAEGNPSPFDHTEEHYRIEILVDNLFTESIWNNLDANSINTQFFRNLVAEAIIKGKVKLEPVLLCGALDDFYDNDSDDLPNLP